MADIATGTIDIETPGEWVGIRNPGETDYQITIQGDDVAEYEFDTQPDGVDVWALDTGQEYAGQADYEKVEFSGQLFARIRCSEGTGNPGDKATIRLVTS
jgi:hypothetical protein